MTTNKEILQALLAQNENIGQLAKSMAILAETLVQETPKPETPNKETPKPTTRKTAKKRKKFVPKYYLTETVKGHLDTKDKPHTVKITFQGKQFTTHYNGKREPYAGFKRYYVTHIDGKPVKDNRPLRAERELPCVVSGCVETRKGLGQYCPDHSAMQTDAYKQAKNTDKVSYKPHK